MNGKDTIFTRRIHTLLCSSGKSKFSKIVPILAGALFLMNPNGVNAQNNISNENRAQAEISTSTYANSNNYKPNMEVLDTPNIINNIEERTGITLPNAYNSKLKTFVETNEVMKSKNGVKYTEDFIVNQMKSRWGIDKQNQLLFIWSAVYEQITGEYFYDGSDGNDNRLEDFSNVMDKVEECGKEYVIGINTYMKKVSAEAERRSAEAIKKIMQQDSIILKRIMIEFYEIYVKNPTVVKKEDINFAKESTKTIIGDCKKYGIDYKAILLKEVGDRRKVEEMLKFYDIE